MFHRGPQLETTCTASPGSGTPRVTGRAGCRGRATSIDSRGTHSRAGASKFVEARARLVRLVVTRADWSASPSEHPVAFSFAFLLLLLPLIYDYGSSSSDRCSCSLTQEPRLCPATWTHNSSSDSCLRAKWAAGKGPASQSSFRQSASEMAA